MKRVRLFGQFSLATALTVLWLRWNPLSPDCGEQGSECAPRVDDPFVDADREPPNPILDALEHVPLEVEYGHCHTVMARPSGVHECIYRPGQALRLWATHPRIDDVEVRVDGHPWSAPKHAEETELGIGMRVTISSNDAKLLSVHVPGQAPWTLSIRAITELSDDERANMEEFTSRGILLESHLVLGRTEALPYTRELVRELLDHGFIGQAIDEVLLTSHHLVERSGQAEQALELLDQLPSLDRLPRERAATAIYRGNALLAQGHLVEAAVAYRNGARTAVRIGAPGLQIDAFTMYSKALAQLGYYNAAAHWGSWVIPVAREEGRDPDLVAALTTVAWANLRLREAGLPYENPGPRFRQALAVRDDANPSADIGELDPARLGLATLAILDGEAARALEWLEPVDSAALTDDQRVEISSIRARVAFTEGTEHNELDRKRALNELGEVRGRSTTLETQWRSAVLVGRLREQAGNPSEAQNAYEEAETILARMRPRGWLGVGGEVGSAAYSEGTERLISLLLDQEHPDEALCVARRAQTQRSRLAQFLLRLDPITRDALRPRITAYWEAKHALEQQEHASHGAAPIRYQRLHEEAERRLWALAQAALDLLATRRADFETGIGCGSLSPRRSGELRLAIYPHLDGFLIFEEDDEGLTYRTLSNREVRVGADDRDWWGRILLDPLDTRLRKAERVKILSAGSAAAIPVHALPWHGRPLAVQIPVVYGLEMSTTSRPPPTGTVPTALVLYQPGVKDAYAESQAVTKSLRDFGWLVLQESSKSESLHAPYEEVSKTDHLHYAGHAYYDEDPSSSLYPPYVGGAFSAPSYIFLGPQGRLEVQDILLMQKVPRTVVLTGCDTGVHDGRTATGGLSLAPALIAAGSAAVMASTQEIPGGDAARVGEGMTAALAEGALGDPGIWFMNGLRHARKSGLSDRAVGDYRIFVP